MRCGILDFSSCTGSDIAADIDHEDLIRHIDLPLMHVIQHFLGSFRPDFLITGVTEEANTDDDVSLQRQAFLRLHESVLKAGASTEGDDFILSYHNRPTSVPLLDAQGFEYRVFRTVIENQIKTADQLRRHGSEVSRRRDRMLRVGFGLQNLKNSRNPGTWFENHKRPSFGKMYSIANLILYCTTGHW